MTTLLSRRRGPTRANRQVAYTVWAWVVVFTTFHVYWYLGGRFGLGDAPNLLPEVSLDPFTVAVWAMFATGLVLPLAITQRWGRRIPRGLLLAGLWTGCAVLILRGLAGVVDDLLRTSGLAANGITGLTYEQVTGSANPSANTMWSGRAIDWYFTLGGLLFGAAALTYRHTRRP